MEKGDEGCVEYPEFKTLLYWIRERELIRLRRQRGSEKPWTLDPIFQRYRFCNVHREDDRVTQWIRRHWGQWGDHPNYTLAMCIARYFNWPDTLAELGFPLSWDPKVALQRIQARELRKEKIWSSAYIVSTNGVQMPKPRYIIQYVLDPISKAAYRPLPGDTLEKAAGVILNFFGVSNFMAGQIVGDLKNTKDHPLSFAPDFKTWCVSGPGSKRGMNRLMGLRLEKTMVEREFRVRVNWLKDYIREHYLIDVDAQDMQNCLCECDKWMRTKLCQGRPRQNYPGGRGQ
jgi:hypothetical protein